MHQQSTIRRLKGHKDAITAIVFLKHADQLLTSSKDTLVKLWDVPTTHCVETLVAHRSEVWSMDVNADETLLVTGSSDAELQLWRIDKDKLGQQLTATSLVDLAAAQQDADPQTSSSRAITLIGPVQRTVSTGDRTVCVRFIEQRLLACQAASKEVEIFQLYDDKAATKKAAKKGREAPLAADRMASLAILRSTSPKIISTDVVLVAKDQNKLTFRFLLAMQKYLFILAFFNSHSSVQKATRSKSTSLCACPRPKALTPASARPSWTWPSSARRSRAMSAPLPLATTSSPLVHPT